MAYAVRFANRASALSLLRPATALPTACLAPMSAMSPKQAEATEYFFKKNKSLKRPLSPHLSIYAPQMTSMLSLTHRATGLTMTAGVYGIGMMPFILAWRFASPTTPFNGIRHLAWDLGLGFSLKELYATGFAVIGLSLATAVVLAFK
ncbi:hypothetical protein MRX96_025293 [Rhipicephalus microplus]